MTYSEFRRLAYLALMASGSPILDDHIVKLTVEDRIALGVDATTSISGESLLAMLVQNGLKWCAEEKISGFNTALQFDAGSMNINISGLYNLALALNSDINKFRKQRDNSIIPRLLLSWSVIVQADNIWMRLQPLHEKAILYYTVDNALVQELAPLVDESQGVDDAQIAAIKSSNRWTPADISTCRYRMIIFNRDKQDRK